MTVAALVLAGTLLGMERACYVWIARSPRSFRAWAAQPTVAWLGEPVTVVEKLFYALKILQTFVFVGWCYLHDPSLMPSAPPAVIAPAVVLFLAAQSLVMIGFYRLGRVTVFFGDRLGYEAPWCSAFPFSVLPHPQYLGAVVSIWAFFAAMRYPHADWYLIALIETIYYVAGAALEERDSRPQGASGRAPSSPTLSND